LARIVHAIDTIGFEFGSVESRQKHRRKDGDDGDHDQ